MFKLFIKEIRLHQWVKNILIFLPAIFANKIFNLNNLYFLAFAFLAFSLTASSLYIINDIFDRDKDRAHPEKKDRPIASGKLSVKTALAWSAIMLLGSFMIIFFINQTLIWLLIGYVVLISLYSIYLKNLPIIDMVVIAIGFIIRIFFGSAVIEVP
ncbi:MAG: Phosphoribose diphosphate:decaprenyl-phosphate phosphoribosyltransferase family protein [Berkelbacteria bacterium GW2011_GWA2_38_9]|uniref:Phosphoribose diphosphate:decaprenyl-phosphate phosphoribosyltransferase family protein n=1 Tax=Berkelbacteria bacterium GW2011_GWA2_38_9 TaxID=1618334 RepID=A0A0G0LG42_9BACT|nr:MAG: Phosphoribose diphosphate:decaprenyl-phosphate phosphoribosyltransferase family protein [Berkelbacteria bacterium GW2011_GWA2_38_9]